VPLVVNTQPDISRTGNRTVLDTAVRGGSWLRSDSVILDEPEQIEELAHRPPWLAVVMEDGYHRHYRTDTPRYRVDAAGVDVIEHTMLHALDVGANYWSLWTEAGNVARYRERRPAAFEALERRIGYRVRPSWIWQRKRSSTDELVVAFANDGAACVPGVLRIFAEARDGKPLAGGGLDAGHPFAGRLRLASFLLPPGMGGSEVRLRAELEVKGVRRRVRWACAQPLDEGGAFVVRLKRHEDANGGARMPAGVARRRGRERRGPRGCRGGPHARDAPRPRASGRGAADHAVPRVPDRASVGFRRGPAGALRAGEDRCRPARASGRAAAEGPARDRRAA
jgi:hypothetical protein